MTFDLEAGSGLGLANESNHRGIIHQWLASPVFANLAKEPVLHRIPLGGASWVMAYRYGQLIGIGQLCLERIFPHAASSAVAAAAVGQDEQPPRVAITLPS